MTQGQSRSHRVKPEVNLHSRVRNCPNGDAINTRGVVAALGELVRGGPEDRGLRLGTAWSYRFNQLVS